MKIYKSLLLAILFFSIGIPCLSSAFEFEEIKTRHPRTLEGFLGLGAPALSLYGFTYYHNNPNDVGIRIQGGQGTMPGKVGYKDEYKEILFFANRSRKTSDWEKFVGVGIGQQNLTIETNFNENSGRQFIETQEIQKTYVTINMTASMFYANGISLSTDFSLRYSMGDQSTYTANANAQGEAPSTYKSIQRDFDFLKNVMASDISFQINLFRLGWYF